MAGRLFSALAVFLALGQLSLTELSAQTNLGANLYLVNRTYRLEEGYAPPDLVPPKVRGAGPEVTLRSEAAQALEQLFSAALNEKGYALQAVSGYRSYSKQRAIYRRKMADSGKERAQLLVAPPGASEHQLGLAMDIARLKSTALSAGFGATPEGQWVAQNAHRFGFIVRYQQPWIAQTGYAYEPWHIRYVGRDHAVQLYALNIPLEEYIGQLSNTRYQTLLEDMP